LDPTTRAALAAQLKALPTDEAAAVIERMPPAHAVDALLAIHPAIAQSILGEMDKGSRRLIAATAPAPVAEQWKRNTRFARGTIGHLMEPVMTTARPSMNVDEAIEALRPIVQSAFVTYVYVVAWWGSSRCATCSSASAWRAWTKSCCAIRSGSRPA
jgi:Mg/Co/Ni transporter MgtE